MATIDIIARGMAGQAGALVSTLQEQLDNQYKAMFTFKGMKETVDELPTSGNKIGDIWYVSNDDDDNNNGGYVWTYSEADNKAVWLYIGKITEFNFDNTPTEGSKNAVTSEGIKKYVDEHGGEIQSLIDKIKIEGEDEPLPIEDKTVTIPLATQLRAGMIKLGNEFELDEDGNMVLAKNEDGTWNIPDNSISINKIMVPDDTTLIMEDEITVNEP